MVRRAIDDNGSFAGTAERELLARIGNRRGIDSASAKGAARLYTRAGFSVVPVPFKKKGCRIQGWADLRITEPEICLHSDAGAQNIGVLTGIGGLTDIDCDAPEAIITGRALLPETTFVFGRQSKRASHYFY